MRQGEFKAGEVIAGTRYRVRGLLGIGGMGSVYEVEHTELGKRFVLKALLRDLSQREDLVARLRNEQRALGRLEHPNIINVTDAGVTTSNVPYFVMERLDGETLGARLKRTGYLPIGEALELAAAVLDGLAAAHEIGVVHRDVKPPNIFLAQGKYPKILDFGVAKITDTNAITARGVAVGTPRYMSPEQASGETLDGRSDIYAVGLVLYESIVGKGPFDDARDPNEMLLAHLSRQAPPLSASVGSVTRELDEALLQLLAKNPGDRPASARDAAARLRSVAAPYAQARHEVAGHARTVRLNVNEPASTTRADGVAARRAWGTREGVTEDAKTLARIGRSPGAQETRTTGVVPRGFTSAATEATTLEDYTATAPPIRTEILPVAEAAWPGDVETRTGVPITPTDGSRTLDPVPLSSLYATTTATRRNGRWVALGAGALFVVALGIGCVLTRAFAPASSPPREPAAGAAANRPAATLAARTLPASTAVAAEARPRSSEDRAPTAAEPPARDVASTSRAAPPVAPPKKSPKKAKSEALSPRVPDGLPSSGL
ncbi:MAG TPA: serine/threonine-protein kinase [Polyangiaceae bacterium]|nr:serine/threonine-protein kinase [Polyangiaceae bacterium]